MTHNQCAKNGSNVPRSDNRTKAEEHHPPAPTIPVTSQLPGITSRSPTHLQSPRGRLTPMCTISSLTCKGSFLAAPCYPQRSSSLSGNALQTVIADPKRARFNCWPPPQEIESLLARLTAQGRWQTPPKAPGMGPTDDKAKVSAPTLALSSLCSSANHRFEGIRARRHKGASGDICGRGPGWWHPRRGFPSRCPRGDAWRGAITGLPGPPGPSAEDTLQTDQGLSLRHTDTGATWLSAFPGARMLSLSKCKPLGAVPCRQALPPSAMPAVHLSLQRALCLLPWRGAVSVHPWIRADPVSRLGR